MAEIKPQQSAFKRLRDKITRWLARIEEANKKAPACKS